MKALRLERKGKLSLVDIEPPVAAEDELLVKTGASLICTSDINDLRRNPFGIALPVTMGHEAAGTVIEVGAAVRGFRSGDRVAAHPVHPCGACSSCRAGLGHLCGAMRHFGINMPGTFAEYFVVRQDRARKVAADMDPATAALAEPVSVCLEALERARLKPGDDLLVIGDGPFGVLIARLAASFEPGRVVVAGHHDFRLARTSAAVRIKALSPDDMVRSALEAAPAGYDAAILAVGSAQAARKGLECLKPRGRLVVFSAITGATEIDLFTVHVRELEILGACNDLDMFDTAVGLLGDDRLGLDELVTHRFAIEDYERAFAVAERCKDEALKVAFVFGEKENA